MKIAILGGGLAGLTLGYLLKEKKYDITIFERESRCGGLLRSYTENGFTFDIGGSHIIFSKEKQILDFMVSLLGDNIVQNKRNTKILLKNRYIQYPFENGLGGLSKEDNFNCLFHFVQNYIQKNVNPPKPPKNLKEWLYYTFGKGITELYLLPYNEKLWKFPPENIGLDWVERIPNPPIKDIIKSSLNIPTEGFKSQSIFYYPKHGGIESLLNKFIEALQDVINLNFNIQEIVIENGDWIVSDGIKREKFDKIISTIPLHELIKTLIGTDKDIKKLVKNLKYNSLITVMVGLDNPKINNYSWIYIPEEKTKTNRVGFPSNLSSHLAPDGKSSVLAEITCKFEDDTWKMDDGNLGCKIIDNLDELNVIDKKNVIFTKIQRIQYAYLINEVDHRKKLFKIKNYLDSMEIDTIGRFASFSYMNMDQIIKSCMDYSDNMV